MTIKTRKRPKHRDLNGMVGVRPHHGHLYYKRTKWFPGIDLGRVAEKGTPLFETRLAVAREAAMALTDQQRDWAAL